MAPQRGRGRETASRVRPTRQWKDLVSQRTRGIPVRGPPRLARRRRSHAQSITQSPRQTDPVQSRSTQLSAQCPWQLLRLARRACGAGLLRLPHRVHRLTLFPGLSQALVEAGTEPCDRKEAVQQGLLHLAVTQVHEARVNQAAIVRHCLMQGT